jgi:tetratricopeptide (TPR) repeat protein
MGLRFFRRMKLAPGLTLNISRSGPSFSFGPRGMKYTIGPRGTRTTFGVPGTGLHYTTSSGRGNGQRKISRGAKAPSTSTGPDLGLFRRMFTSPEERQLVDGLRLFLAGDTAKAYQLFSSCSSPLDAVFMRGFIALGQGTYLDAEKNLVRCRATHEDLGKAIGKYMQDFTLSLRVTDYIDASVDVDDRGAALALVEALQAQQKFDEAIQVARDLWNRNATDTVICLSLCELVIANPSASSTDLDDIVQMSSTILNDDPIHTNILYLRGAAMFRMHFADAGIKQFSAILRKKKGRPPELMYQIRYLRGRLYEQKGSRARARKDYELIYTENPGFKDVSGRLRQLTPNP